MPCAVPCCKPEGQPLLLKFPRSHFLCKRWRQAIELGTGFALPTEHNPLDAEICQQHFKQTDGDYIEPVIFHNQSMGREVYLSSCQLCLRFRFSEKFVTGSVDKIGNAPLEEVLKVGFGIQLSSSDFLSGICQECLVRLDLYVTMRKQFSLAAKSSQQMKIFIQGEKRSKPKKTNSTKTEIIAMDWEIVEENDGTFPAEQISSTLETVNVNEEDTDGERSVKKQTRATKALTKSSCKPRKQPRFKQKKPAVEQALAVKQTVARRPCGRPIKERHLKSLSDRKCYICTQLLETRAELFSHILNHVGCNLRCETCNESFANLTRFNRHLAKHDPTARPLKCDHCELRFANSYCKRRHENLNHNVDHPVKPCINPIKKGNFTCQHCGRQCNSLSGLHEHEDTHAGIKRFQCITCNQLFPTKTNLERHHLIHTAEKPFKCAICGKGFRQSPLLKDHLRLHTGETPYSCSRCELRFSSSSQLRRHGVNVHGLTRLARTKTGENGQIVETS